MIVRNGFRHVGMMLFASLSCTLGARTALAELHTEAVVYQDGDQKLEGYLAYDAAKQGQRPGVLVVHEWWGLTEHPKESARKLAAAGYVALAVDMFGAGKVTDDAKQAGEWSGGVKGDPALLKRRFEAGLAALKARPEVDPAKIAAIGYCFGGTVVLEAARLGEPLAGVASFHGGLKSKVPPEERKLKAQVLVLHGADDKFESDEEIAAFKEEMKKSGVKWQMEVYPGAVHSFTNPDVDRHNLAGAKYNAEAAQKSWDALMKFLSALFA